MSALSIVPNRFSDVLRQNQALDSAVRLSIERFKPWIEKNDLYFFPEFTDHGIRHLSLVAELCQELISDDVWKVSGLLSSEDVAAIILAVLAHDLAMHFRPDNFLQLVGEESSFSQCLATNGLTWLDAWQEFLGEARRFDDKTLIDIFGDDLPATIPGPDPEVWTIRDRRLIGEFIRRHHPQIAYLLCVEGVPVSGHQICMSQDLDLSFRTLVGTIARSHGQPLRRAIAGLSEDDARQSLQTHPAFLMGLLRVADYLDIRSDRAPAQLLDLLKIRSPFSAREWDAHAAVREIKYHRDPKAIKISCAPRSIRTLLRIREWCEAFQKELDTTWAVLGETYGRYDKEHENLDKLGLRIRRVTSNVDTDEEFHATLPQADYLPKLFRFDSNSDRLLPLLVGPLYGDDPSYGVRELTANAMDAVVERQERLRHEPDLAFDPYDQQVDVEVKVDADDRGHTVTITDKGVGMDEEVISNYFLRAGASFRGSGEWKKLFVNDQGRATLRKVGRFGIGVLASFLIGDEIEVTTRRLGHTTGLAFQAKLSDDVISVKSVNCPTGTRIRIRVNPGISEELSRDEVALDDWLWSVVEWPSIRIIGPNGQVYTPRHKLAQSCEQLPVDWYRLVDPRFEDIQWTFENVPNLTCNGIEVSAKRNKLLRYAYRQERREEELRLPRLNVYDVDALLPLNLQRTQLIEALPFRDSLLHEVAVDIIKTLNEISIKDFSIGSLSSLWRSAHTDQGPEMSMTSWSTGLHPGLLPRAQYGQRDLAPLIFYRGGIIPVDGYFLSSLSIKELLIVPIFMTYGKWSKVNSDLSLLAGKEWEPEVAMANVFVPDGDVAMQNFLRSYKNLNTINEVLGVSLTGGNCMLPEETLSRIDRQGGRKSVIPEFKANQYTDGWTGLRFGNASQFYDLRKICGLVPHDSKWPGMIAFTEINVKKVSEPTTHLGKAWKARHGVKPITLRPSPTMRLPNLFE